LILVGDRVSNLATVQGIYAAFGRGDVPDILAALADDVEWEYGVNSTDVPWLQPRRGRDGAAGFFESLGAMDIRRFEVSGLFEAGSTVVALVQIEFTVKATGRSVVEEDELHVWGFDSAGKVARFRHRADTHQQYLAFHGA
jgi:ketosteroid isomerase-like protein